MKFFNRQYENRVKQNAVIIFLLATLLCSGMIYYVVNNKNSINNQKNNIQKNEELLNLTNDLIEKVNIAQSYTNLFTMFGNKNYLNNFKILTSEISKLSDSITKICDESFNTKTINEIILLLHKKEDNINEIKKQLDSFNPYKEIYSIIDNYQYIPNNATISKTIQDTIIYKTEKKNFFKRLGEVFSPNDPFDSLVLVSKTTIDTINKENDNYGVLLDQIQQSTEKSKSEYIKQIKAFEIKYNNLSLADQELTKEISDLLINLHKYTLNSVIKEIEESEFIIDRNINLSISIAFIALLTILTFIFFIFYDVKKVVKARKATEEAKKRTEEIMESRHKLLLSVSHDIKTPLSSIIGYLELMEIDNEKEEEIRRICSMRNSAEHILSLLTNLLNYSRLDQGKESLILSKFNIVSICDELNDMFTPLAENKQLNFIYENKLPQNTCIKSDALKIKQILVNLLSNAVKYTTKGNIRFIIEIKNKRLTFTISDEGIGIPQDKINEIYKPFSRIDNEESHIEGNGFGLFVVKGLIDLLHGNIEVKSELGNGSQFIVDIPYETAKLEDVKTTTNELVDIKSKTSHNVLVVDDDDSLLKVIESMILKLGCKCDICHSSVEFDNYLKIIDFYDVIMTDSEMGVFNGIDVLKKVKEKDFNKKVVLMTARSEYNKENALSRGFDNYLRKPFSIKDLSELLNNDAIVTNNNSDKSRFDEDFPELCAMFEHDNDAIENILKTFAETTSNNLLTFNDIINNNSFKEAVNLCHKMYPMFVQLNQSKMAEFLHKMDQMRNKDTDSFPEWKEESIEFMKDVDEFITYITEKYDIE